MKASYLSLELKEFEASLSLTRSDVSYNVDNKNC
jgi:hypothetical protein